MKKSFLTAFVLSSMLLTGVAIADTQRPIHLGTIIVAPSSQKGISLSKLQPRIDYNVQCGIESAARHSFEVGFDAENCPGGTFVFNGTNVGPIIAYYQRPLIPSQKNTLIAQRVHHGTSAINFTNTSKTNFLSVTCSATVNPTVR
ncbi:MAG TPA: hypothetical protein VJK30_03115 [Coxiellaceae bacterium]|nr:MAG: hypothetical protein A3E81_03115 [Gammaproteobacteria bacterium RIFCSPHIGHO2_12_FULL_36_30]HLB56305.1 hypothetical protein [Coxiellaceae bacterium]